MQNEKLFLDVEDIAKCMSISIPTAYKLIKKLNDELKESGYITVAGKVNRKYFEKKLFGGLA